MATDTVRQCPPELSRTNKDGSSWTKRQVHDGTFSRYCLGLRAGHSITFVEEQSEATFAKRVDSPTIRETCSREAVDRKAVAVSFALCRAIVWANRSLFPTISATFWSVYLNVESFRIVILESVCKMTLVDLLRLESGAFEKHQWRCRR